MNTKKKYKERIKIYKGFIKDVKISSCIKLYERKLKEAENILDIIENHKLTPELFDKLDCNDKWDLLDWLTTKVDWYCGHCGCEQDEPYGTFDSIECCECNGELTHRTGGGQHNPFEWTFKYNEKYIRKLKIQKLNEKP